MKSHEYHFRLAEGARLLGPLFIAPLIFAAAMRLGAWIGALPSPWPALGVDNTILTHQAAASQCRSGADILLVGDSSCLMDVRADKMQDLLPEAHRIQSLGTFMYVGFNGYSALLSRYAAANPGAPKTVVCLVHPEMLRAALATPEYLLFISDYYAGADSRAPDSIHGQICGLFGLNIFQGRLYSRLPLPLPKEYGRYYGFNLDLYRFMEERCGSAVDPHQYYPSPGQGNAEYKLAPALQSSCSVFKAAMPPRTRLLAGLTPVPESFAPPNYGPLRLQLLEQWGQWLEADGVLTNLPATFPDRFFASTTHLNEKGAELFTENLAKCIKPSLRSSNKAEPSPAAR
jgi:hypothetical protein